jgi:hypothetical protein
MHHAIAKLALEWLATEAKRPGLSPEYVRALTITSDSIRALMRFW